MADGLANEADFPWDSDGYKGPQSEFLDNITFDGRFPNDYLDALEIGLKDGETVQNGTLVQ